jgi:hypothetical protein
MELFKLYNLKTGKFAGKGLYFTKYGKFWSSESYLKCAMTNRFGSNEFGSDSKNYSHRYGRLIKEREVLNDCAVMRFSP